jgi:hypothetical protein
MRRRSWALLAGAVLLVAAAAGHLLVQGRTFTITLSEADLQARLAEAPPFTRTLLGVVRVTLDSPRVSLVEGSDRVHAGADVDVRVALGRRELSAQGTVDASGGVRYHPETGEFFLTDPVVEGLSVPGFPPEHLPRARDAIGSALRVYFDRNPIYTLRPGDVRHAAARLLLRDVRVVDRRLVATLAL